MYTQKHDPPLILVADDQMPTTLMLERVFNYEGYQVKSVYDGYSAIEAATAEHPDLILLDINMPGINGFEVLKKLRENPITSSIPTILITAMGDFSHVVQGLNLGADDYLRKPFHPQELLARAQSKMKARQLEEALQRRTKELEALLEVGQQLNQHLKVDDLLDLIINTMKSPTIKDLIQAEYVGFIYLDADGHVSDCRTYPYHIPDDVIQRLIELSKRNQTTPYIWYNIKESRFLDYPAGIIMPIRYADVIRGVLFVADQSPFGETDSQLLEGLGSQMSLALQNAELYDIKAHHAMILEAEVNKRTSELKSTQQMLIRSEKLASVGRLAASIAHEINNPLFPIQINLEDMLEDLKEGKSIHQNDVLKTLESVDRIKHVVSRLLEFTGNRQNDQDGFAPVNLNGIIQYVVSLNRKFFQKNGIEITEQLSDLPNIAGNKYQLEHVFMNLALNASDAMENGGTLKFETHSQNDQIIAIVEDTGSGIPADLINDIFEPFVTTKSDGNGLGLFISYGIIQSHKGEVKVESEPGVGTRFTVTFPIR